MDNQEFHEKHTYLASKVVENKIKNAKEMIDVVIEME